MARIVARRLVAVAELARSVGVGACDPADLTDNFAMRQGSRVFGELPVRCPMIRIAVLD
jgi:hypothetical protein